MTLRFDSAAGAAEGSDPQLGEDEAPPAPPWPLFDARWLVSRTYGAWNDCRDVRAAATGVTWVLAFLASDAEIPVAVAWDPAQLSDDGPFRLRQVGTGAVVGVDLRRQAALQLDSPGTVELQLGMTVGSVRPRPGRVAR